MTQLREVMHAPVYGCAPTNTLATAAQEMEAHNVGSLLVTDHDDRILGVVTDRDIALAIGRGTAPDATVDKISSHSVVTIRSDSDVHEAASLMGHKGVWRLPVLDNNGRAVGIVSLNDLFEFVAQETQSLAQAAHSHSSARM